VVIAYPLLTVLDDSGAIVSGATVTVASVKDMDGTDVASPGATVHQSGANVCVTYDAEAKGEAWITLAISKVGSTFTGWNAAPSFFVAKDSGRLLTGVPNAAPNVNGGLPILSNSGGSLAYAVASVAGDVAGKLLGGGSGTINASAIGAMVDIYSVNGTRARFDVYTAQSVGASSITLQSDDPDASANLKNYRVRILSAGNASAAGQIATFNTNTTSGARQVTPAWGIVPTGTVLYEKLNPLPPVDLASTAFDQVMVETGWSLKDAQKVQLAVAVDQLTGNSGNTLTVATMPTPTRGLTTQIVATMTPVGTAGARDRTSVLVQLSGT
jgi:hypothetical protein